LLFIIPVCGFQEWQGDATAPATAATAEARTCRNCGEVGHLAKACSAPKKPDTRECRVCGEVGHIARNCPSAPSPEPGAAPTEGGNKGRRKKRSGTQSLSSKRCFNCGQNGHLSAVRDLQMRREQLDTGVHTIVYSSMVE